MTIGSWFRAVGHSISHLATGIVHFASTAVNKVAGAGKYVFDGGVWLVKTINNDVSTTIGTAAHEAGGAVKGVASSLAFPLAIGAAALGECSCSSSNNERAPQQRGRRDQSPDIIILTAPFCDRYYNALQTTLL